jgi:hypothetical protein
MADTALIVSGVLCETATPHPGAYRHRPPMQFKEGSLRPRRCGPTNHESLCQRWLLYLPSTGRLVAGFLPPSGWVSARLFSTPNVTMDQRLFSFLKPLQWIKGGRSYSKRKRTSRRCSSIFFSGGWRRRSDLDRCEQVLRLKRKGRTGFKPSGLRDELPGLPVPSVEYSTKKSPLCSERRAIGRRFNQVAKWHDRLTSHVLCLLQHIMFRCGN